MIIENTGIKYQHTFDNISGRRIKNTISFLTAEWFLSLDDFFTIMHRRTTIFAIFDFVSVSLVFSLFLLSKNESFHLSFSKYLYSFILFLIIWFMISLIGRKYRIHQMNDLNTILRQILLGNLFVLGLTTTLMFLVRIDYYSRAVVFGTIITVTLLEIIWGSLDYYLRTAILEPPDVVPKRTLRKRQLLREVFTPKRAQVNSSEIKQREEAILVEIDKDAFDFIFSYAPIESAETFMISTTSRFNVEMQMKEKFDSIINLKRINDIRYINKFFEVANKKLPVGGLFIDFVETKNLRKKRILDKYPIGLNYIAYLADYIIKRVFPKFLLTKGLYFFLTRGQNRVFTKAETYGRLYSCGFEIIDEKQISKHLFFIARKVRAPHYPENPSYGPFIKLERVGYKGDIIRVYKLRTMHPYAEYLQEYVYMKMGLEKGGKFKSDFRVSTLGKFLRTFWLDELPMFINLFKREMKLVGVRPLSKHYFSLYSKELQERRIQYKPGLIPPYYADKPQSLEEIMKSEFKYLDSYDKHPIRTDIKYFFMAGFNIVFKRYRSK